MWRIAFICAWCNRETDPHAERGSILSYRKIQPRWKKKTPNIAIHSVFEYWWRTPLFKIGDVLGQCFSELKVKTKMWPKGVQILQLSSSQHWICKRKTGSIRVRYICQKSPLHKELKFVLQLYVFLSLCMRVCVCSSLLICFFICNNKMR